MNNLEEVNVFIISLYIEGHKEGIVDYIIF